MVRSEAIEVLARRLGINAGRVAALAQRAADSGALPKARGRDVPELSSLEMAYVILAAIADRGIGVAGASVREFGALQSAEGLVFADLLEGWVAGRASVAGVQSVVVQLEPAGVSVTTAGHHFRFGADHAGGAAKQVCIRGDDLAAAILEMQGIAPRAADEQVAVGRLAAALH